MVTIEMLASASSDGVEYEAGETYDVSFALADHFIRAGYARSADGDPTAPAVEVVDVTDSDAASGDDAGGQE